MKGHGARPALHPRGGPARWLHSQSHPGTTREPQQGPAKPSAPQLRPGQQESPAAHLQVEARVLHHPLCQCGDVDPPIALPCEEEIVLGVLGEEPEEILQRQVVVASDLQGGGDGGQAARQDPQRPGRGRQEAGPSQQSRSLTSVSFVAYFLSSE